MLETHFNSIFIPWSTYCQWWKYYIKKQIDDQMKLDKMK